MMVSRKAGNLFLAFRFPLETVDSLGNLGLFI